MELTGYNLFISEKEYDSQGNATKRGADCWHCHAPEQDMFDNTFRNNALDVFPDSGLAAVTKSGDDLGKFKVPSLRNIAETFPYMHDGRFSTLEEVINHYSEGIKNHPNLDWRLQTFSDSGAGAKKFNFTQGEKESLIAFLKTFTDQSFIEDPRYSDPFQ